MNRRRLDLTQGTATKERPDPAESRHTKIDVLAEPAAAAVPMAAPLAPIISAEASVPMVSSGSLSAPIGPGNYQKRRMIHGGHLTSLWLASHAHRRNQWFVIKQLHFLTYS
jgi:hypothetical protein